MSDSEQMSVREEQGNAIKIETSEESVMVNLNPDNPHAVVLNITDLNDHDCLEPILMKLDLDDLINVADSSKLMRSVVRSVYAKKYGRKSVIITSNSAYSGPKYEIDENNITANSIANSLKILRCFGKMISKSEIRYSIINENARARNVLDSYISGYCVESMIAVEIYYFKNEDTQLQLKIPLVNVGKVCFAYANFEFGAPYNLIQKCFPNVRRLEFRKCWSAEIRKMTHLPHLEQLTIWNDNNSFGKQNAINTIRFNPKLKCLCLKRNIDFSILQSASEHLKQIEYLDFEITVSLFNDKTLGEMIYFKNVKKFKFSVFYYSLHSIPISFDQLEEFTFCFTHSHTTTVPYIEHLVEFISRHPKISKFESKGPLDDRLHSTCERCRALQIGRALPSVKVIEMHGIRFEVDGTIGLLQQCPLLKMFRFKLSGEFKDLQKRLNREWRSTMDDSGFVQLDRTS